MNIWQQTTPHLWLDHDIFAVDQDTMYVCNQVALLIRENSEQEDCDCDSYYVMDSLKKSNSVYYTICCQWLLFLKKHNYWDSKLRDPVTSNILFQFTAITYFGILDTYTSK